MAAYAFQPGQRVEHLGSRGSFGTVQRVEPHRYGDPAYYADVLVRWDDDCPSSLLAGKVSRAGLRSLCHVAGQRVAGTTRTV